jgi:hypothetical protein
LLKNPSASGFQSLLVFDHIPKTAGTTFRRSYLTAALPRDQRWILSGGSRNADDLERFLRLPHEQRQRIRIVAGHYAERLRAHQPDARFLTIVRDPVDRIVSSYLHARFHPGGEALWPDVRERPMGLREFALRYERPNSQSAQLLGEGEFGVDGIRRQLRSRYALAGCTELFDQFVFVLHVREGLPLCLYNNRLVRRERATYAPSPADREFLAESNQQDVLLHHVVRAEFQRVVEQMSPEDREAMERFLTALMRFRNQTRGEPATSLSLEESSLKPEAIEVFEFVFGRRPQRGGE